MTTEVSQREIRAGKILLVTRAREKKGLLDALCVVRARDVVAPHVVLEFITGWQSRSKDIYRLDEFGFVEPSRDFVLAAIGEEALLEIESMYRADQQSHL